MPAGDVGGVWANVENFTPVRADVVEAVEACAVFDQVSDDVRAELVDAFDGVRLETGETLMRYGEAADALYLVRHGRLRILLPESARSREIGQVGKGEVVGEMALITDAPRTATAVAMRDTELYRLPAAVFLDVIQRHPTVLRPFAAVVVERHRRALTHRTRSTLPATIVLLPAPGCEVEDLAVAMEEAIVSYRVAVVRPADAADRPNLAAWLLEIENAVDVSLLIADPEPTVWTRQCLRHADRVLMVVDEATPVARTPVESDDACARRMLEVPVELIARYRTAPPSSSWVPGRRLNGHHNVADGVDADIGRLVRRLTATSTVLVLGGGGAKGFAHFGVIRGLLDAGIDIDAVVGTSAGALVGGMLARYGEIAGHDDELFAWFESVRWRRDLTPPAVALLTGRLMTEGFKELYGDRRIEDLAMDYVAVSTDLKAAAPYVHKSGPLWQAVRASAAVPGIFPPVALDGTVLVDGGLVANLPVSIARERHRDARIIAVEVGDVKDVEVGSLDGSGIASGWATLRHRGDGTPTLPKVLMRLTDLGRSDDASAADLVIRPDLAGYGLTDTSDMHAIVERGAKAVAEVLPDLVSGGPGSDH